MFGEGAPGLRFHELVDLELEGRLTAAEAAELAQLRRWIDQESKERVQAMREEFARQDQMFADAVSAHQKSRSGIAAKTASNRK
ncbi:hypothetical protein F183_A20850 [Bryobacterales bacterium F-183]|nr:hypothetical protein F183_A20850 [Bryobacterales bacterium F-183]